MLIEDAKDEPSAPPKGNITSSGPSDGHTSSEHEHVVPPYSKAQDPSDDTISDDLAELVAKNKKRLTQLNEKSLADAEEHRQAIEAAQNEVALYQQKLDDALACLKKRKENERLSSIDNKKKIDNLNGMIKFCEGLPTSRPKALYTVPLLFATGCLWVYSYNMSSYDSARPAVFSLCLGLTALTARIGL